MLDQDVVPKVLYLGQVFVCLGVDLDLLSRLFVVEKAIAEYEIEDIGLVIEEALLCLLPDFPDVLGCKFIFVFQLFDFPLCDPEHFFIHIVTELKILE